MNKVGLGSGGLTCRRCSQDGLSESKGKITRLSKAIATKAPEALRDIKGKLRPGGRTGSGGGAQEMTEWETDSVR